MVWGCRKELIFARIDEVQFGGMTPRNGPGRAVQFVISPELDARLSDRVAREDRHKSWLIRKALTEFLDRLDASEQGETTKPAPVFSGAAATALPIPGREPLTRSLQVRLTEAEYASVAEAAARLGVSMNWILRQAVLLHASLLEGQA